MNIPIQEQAKQAGDYALGAGAVSAPWWLAYFDIAANVLLALGGLSLLAIRGAITWREWKNPKK